MNQMIRICKVLVLIALTVAVFLYWQRFGDFQSIVLVAFLAVSAVVWCLLAWAFVTCYFEKSMIQKRLVKAERGLEEIAAATIKSYRPSRSENYATLRFCSEGVPAEVWEPYVPRPLLLPQRLLSLFL